LPACSARGIAVSNIPADGTGNTQATAEHALFLAMGLLRRSADGLPARPGNGFWGCANSEIALPEARHRGRIRQRRFDAVRVPCDDGCPRDGSAAKRTTVDTPACGGGAITICTNLDEVLPTTDVLILACTMSPETFHLENERRLSLLPATAVVVNVRRGP
jgi:lactate dehydrogenase-like 2-hydroxyacid dehydrogenase